MDVYLQTQKNLGGCHIEISQVTNDIEKALIWNSTEDKEALLKLFGVTNLNMDRRDFMSFVSDIWAGAV